jgi:hypothetical protein
MKKTNKIKYVATVNFAGFKPGEIVEIPEDNDLPESYFKSGFFVPYEKPQEIKPSVEKKPEDKIVSLFKDKENTNITRQNTTKSPKPDKI